MTLGQTISYLRDRRGLSQSTLAKELNVGTSTLGMWETDKRKPNADFLVSIAQFFGVTTDYLLGNETPSTPKHIDVDDIVNNQAMLTSRNHALSDEDHKAIRALLTTYLNSDEGQDRLRKFGGYGDDGKKQDESD